MIKNPPIIKKVVLEMGGTIKKIIPERGCFLIEYKEEKIFFSRKFQIASDFLSGRLLTAHKDLTLIALNKYNLPTPKSACFYKKSLTPQKIKHGLAQLNYPIVIKDSDGSNSRGVFVDIKNISEAKKIIMKEIDKYPCLIAQEMVYGKEFRVLILENKAIGVLEMIPPRVFGNGKDTVQELIEKKQLKLSQKTALDDSLKKILKNQNLKLNSIPKKDQLVYIKKNSCLAEGGETMDLTEKIHPEIEKICTKASRAVGKNLAGIDIICDDITKHPDEQKINILEINGKPDLYIHYNPTHGKTRNVIKEIIEFIVRLKK